MVRSVGFVASGAALILVPKCPACIAAWVALATGFSLSATAASQVRVAVLVGCATLLLAIALGTCRRLRRH